MKYQPSEKIPMFENFIAESKGLKIGGGFNKDAESYFINKWKSPTGLSITAANGVMNDKILDFRIHLSQGDTIRVKGKTGTDPKISVTTKDGTIKNLSWNVFADNIYGHSDSLVYDLLLFWEDQYWNIHDS